MHDDEREDTIIYNVVVNLEEQFSIWPIDRDMPLGWSPVGPSGNKQECLEYIKVFWTDLRPRSLRQQVGMD